MATFRCTIVTPARSVFDADVAYATLPAWDGQLGVMRGRSPLLARLETGLLRVDRAEGGSSWFMVEGGFAQIQGDQVTVLTERAWTPDEVDVAEAERELAAGNRKVLEQGAAVIEGEQMQARSRAKQALAAAGR